MRTIALVVVGCWASSALCQTPAKEPDTQQALLVEVRQLRQDIEAVMVASQRVQIALYSLQLQDAAVARAAQRFDDARSKCAAVETGRARMAADLQRVESALSSGTMASNEAKELQSHASQLKSQIELQATEARTCQTTEVDASNQLRNSQAKLADLQDRIERLDKALEKLGIPGK